MGNTGVTGGQYPLFYTPETGLVQYTTADLDTFDFFNNITSSSTSATTGWQSYITSEPLLAGRYYVQAVYRLGNTTTQNPQLQCQIVNNSDNSTFGNYGNISYRLASLYDINASLCGISILQNTNTFSWQYRRMDFLEPIIIRVGRLSCIRLGPV
jgi:hypothetical protein